MPGSRNWYVGIVLCLVLALVVFLAFRKESDSQPIEFLPISIASTSLASSSQPATAKISPAPTPTIPKGYKEYRNEQYHFSLYYPGDIPVKEYAERGAATTITFQPGNGKPGFQVFVQNYNGAQITEERFKLDEPSGVMKDPVDFTLDGAPARSFYGYDPQIGDTHEVWFIKNGYLYEVTTYKALDTWLSDIMKTWKFL